MIFCLHLVLAYLNDDASFREMDGFSESMLAFVVSLNSYEYECLLRERISDSNRRPVGFLVPLLNQVVENMVVFNVYFIYMDAELFYFLEFTRSNASIFSREIFQPDSPGIYCLIVSVYLPDSDEEMLLWLPVDSESFYPYFEENSYIAKSTKVRQFERICFQQRITDLFFSFRLRSKIDHARIASPNEMIVVRIDGQAKHQQGI